jgi:hypothetical protein
MLVRKERNMMTRTSVQEESVMGMLGGLAVEVPDGETLKQWARLAAQANTLAVMAITSGVYNAFWWQLMAVKSHAHVLEYARNGQQRWAMTWLGSLYQEARQAAQGWQEVSERLSVLFGTDRRGRWWVNAATASAEQMAALAQQVEDTVLLLCARWGVALPQELAGLAVPGQVVVAETSEIGEEAVDGWHE